MKKVILGILALVMLTGCGGKKETTSKDILLWMHLSKLKITPTDCKSKVIEHESYVGCYFNYSGNRPKSFSVWLIDNSGKNTIFYAVNGAAKGISNKLRSSDVKVLPSEAYQNIRGNPIGYFNNLRK